MHGHLSKYLYPPIECQALCITYYYEPSKALYWFIGLQWSLVSTYLPGTNCSFFDESPILQSPAKGGCSPRCYMSTPKSKIFMIKDVPTQLRSKATFISVLFNKKEVAFSPKGNIESPAFPILHLGFLICPWCPVWEGDVRDPVRP